MGKILLKTIVLTSVLTIFLLFFIAYIVYRFDISDKYMEWLVVLIYIIANFAGGFMIGKITEYRKYLWGALVGITYIVVLLVISFFANKGMSISGAEFVITAISCILPATIGGMLS